MKRSIDDSTATIPKPVFLTKARRERQALERHHIQVTGHRRNQEDFLLSTNNRDKEHEEEIKPAEREKEEEVETIKSKKPKMRVIKPTEKFIFSFEWENPEDILRELDIMNQEDAQLRMMVV
ncbi:unnamed protein product [Vicia faba]|uniref:Uncharacterized protein n=1 Tax=Vicia faba TaxID=3906 RepID=A0AAV0YHQ3_VICFA|nr:unnamed protein product [Vicia faba]